MKKTIVALVLLITAFFGQFAYSQGVYCINCDQVNETINRIEGARAEAEVRAAQKNDTVGHISLDKVKMVGGISWGYPYIRNSKKFDEPINAAIESCIKQGGSADRCKDELGNVHAGFYDNDDGKQCAGINTYIIQGVKSNYVAFTPVFGSTSAEVDGLLAQQCNAKPKLGSEEVAVHCSKLITYCTPMGPTQPRSVGFNFPKLSPEALAQYRKVYPNGMSVNGKYMGVIAFAVKERKFGASEGKVSDNTEENKTIALGALKQCGHDNCKIVKTYFDSCVAAVYGEKKDKGDYDFIAEAPTIDQASKIAMQSCQKNAESKCQVFYKKCAKN